MRRAAVLAGQLAQRAGAIGAAKQAVTAGCISASQLRHFAAAANGESPKVVPNPLQKIVPPILNGIGAAVNGIQQGSAALVDGLTNGPATRSAIAFFADKVLLSGIFVETSDIDVPKWAAWLAASGYDNKQGWDKLLAAVKANVPKLQPSEIEALIPALHSAGHYDKQLFQQFAAIIKDRFTEFETPGLAKILSTYAAHDYFDQELWDDVADSITYCNHYLSPLNAPVADIAALFAAYAKYEVNRGDLFVTLARTIHEDRLKPLSDSELQQVVGSLLSSFKTLAFYPDCTEALIVAGRLRPSALGPAENAIMADAEREMRGHAPDGKLPWLDGGYKDPEHFHGNPFGSYNLWIARNELTPTYYKPSDISPRPASMTSPPPAPGGATAEGNTATA
eukprot:GHRR01000708.1.p1 GENE.GHRR01000708.1~~GHRR01000708.1.p1  ORF type:complete len:394 (+),score=145.47 GHRR01000708.1:136-1317(+)